MFIKTKRLGARSESQVDQLIIRYLGAGDKNVTTLFPASCDAIFGGNRKHLSRKQRDDGAAVTGLLHRRVVIHWVEKTTASLAKQRLVRQQLGGHLSRQPLIAVAAVRCVGFRQRIFAL